MYVLGLFGNTWNIAPQVSICTYNIILFLNVSFHLKLEVEQSKLTS